MTKIKMPSAYTILIGIIAVVAFLTWIIPAGKYKYETDSEPIPGSYHRVEPNRQNIGDVAMAPLNGFYEAIDVAAFILMVGGFLGVMGKTKAIDVGISNIVKKLKGKEKLLIPILMTLFALGGTTFGMWEETMAFYPLILPIIVSAGYDTVTAVSIIMLGAGAGVLGSTVNPFASGIASGFAGVSIGDGIIVRIVILIAVLAACILYVSSYAEKVKNNPLKSVVADMHDENIKHFAINNSNDTTLKLSHKTALLIFAATFLLMVYSVIPFSSFGLPFYTLNWWFPQLSALFLVSAVLMGLFCRLSEEVLINSFLAGAADLLGVSFIIGISRGITVVMNSGNITDTMLHWGETAISTSSSIFFIIITYLLYIPFSFLVPSSSGLATLSMPIIAPLADFSGVARHLVVTAFQSSSGLVNLITPTSAVIMGGLAIGRIPFERWVKYVWRLILMLFAISLVIILLSTMLP